jgi:hypothetical protein
MTQKTDLNVSPYYDDFDEEKNFQNILFRPGFAVQARELSQIPSFQRWCNGGAWSAVLCYWTVHGSCTNYL